MVYRRSSYSIGNAARFLPYFMEAINNKKNILVPASVFGVQLTTLQQQCTDALRFLVCEYEEVIASPIIGEDVKGISKEALLTLRATTKIKTTLNPPGVIICGDIQADRGKGQKERQEDRISPQSKDWKNRVIDFLDSSDSFLAIEKLTPTLEESQWIHKVLSAPNIEYVIANNSLKIVRSS